MNILEAKRKLATHFAGAYWVLSFEHKNGLTGSETIWRLWHPIRVTHLESHHLDELVARATGQAMEPYESALDAESEQLEAL